jgi:hypothetical protein
MAYSRDTSPEAERVQIELLRRMTPARRLELVGELNRLARAFCFAGLRARMPGSTPQEIEHAFIRLTLGESLGRAVIAERKRRGLDPDCHD